MQLFINSFTVLDFSFLCPLRGMVGESWNVDIKISGNLDQQNMIFDFGEVKSQIKSVIDEYVDHRLFIPTEYEGFNYSQASERAVVHAQTKIGSFFLDCPSQAYTFIPTQNITSDSVKKYLEHLLMQHMPENVTNVEIQLHAESLSMPYYHYSHGLKKHAGNCQRIAHGHRSPIEIYRNDILDKALTQQWAERWQDIYLGSEEDLVALSTLNIPESSAVQAATHYAFSYQAKQGQFHLAVPRVSCEIIPHDTTVELLANFIAASLKNNYPDQSIKVIAYEGIQKGAISLL